MKCRPPSRDRVRARFEILEDRRLLAAVVGRHIFYNQSAFDGNDPAINADDDNAIAPDKKAYFVIEQLTDNAVFDSEPMVIGDQIVWQGRGGTDGGADDEIFWYDGSTITQLTENGDADRFPKISALGVAWERGTGATKKIVFDDLVNPEVLLGTPLGSFTNIIALTDTRLSWEDQSETDFEIFTWTGSGSPTNLSNNAFTDRFVDGEGNKVVWVEIEGSTRRVRFFDGTTTSTVGTSTFAIEDPDVSGTSVAWEGFEHGGTFNREIYYYNGTIVQLLTNDAKNDFDPQISGNKIVWWSNVAGVSKIQYFNGLTISEISTGNLSQFPQIDGDNIVWQGSDGNDFEIFYFDGQNVIQLTNNDIDDTRPQISGNHVVWQRAIPANGNSQEIMHTYVVPQAELVNLTNFTRGITGIMVDIAGSGNHAAITASDFVFKVGSNNTPASWAAAPAPSDVQVRLGAGDGGSDRVVITWPEGTIANQWLQVEVLATANTGLGAHDVHYWANLVGETASATPSGNFARTVAADGGAILSNGTQFNVGITNLLDINKSNSVTVAADRGPIVTLGTGFLTRIGFGTPPPMPGPLADSDGAGSAVASAMASHEEASATDSDVAVAAGISAPTLVSSAPAADRSGPAALASRIVDRLASEGNLENAGLDELFDELAASAVPDGR